MEVTMAFNFLAGKRHIILYGISLSLLLVLLNWLKLRLVVLDHAFEVYIGSIALVFTGLGIWVALKLARPKEKIVVVEKEIYIDGKADFTLNETALNQLGLSKRELEVLQLMAQGLSNKEIAQQLFVSLSTIKTHANNLFDKMGVERRTQAINKAKQLGIIS
jgi:two-component system, NarL family, response regulator LiaR